jgi:hypothetical protein
MTPEVHWGTVAKPLGRWVLKHLPTFVFAKYYNRRDLEEDIKIRLRSARLETVKVARKLQVPYFEAELEAFNMSPYLDVHVRGVRSHLLAWGEVAPEPFAELDDWAGFDLPRGSSHLFHLTYWLNEYQMAIVSTYLKERLSMRLYVMLCAESRVGLIFPFKHLDIGNTATQ